MQNWNKVPRFFLILILLIGLCAGLFAPRMESVDAKPMAACPDTTITQWTFTNTTTPSTGIGNFSYGTGITLSPTPYPADTSADSPSISFSNWGTPFNLDEYIEFQVDTTGRDNIVIGFKYRATSSGPSTLELHYSIDGNTFAQFGVPAGLTRDSNFYQLSFDLSSISALNDNSLSKFRVYAYGATSGSGTFRIDNLTVSGDCPYSPLMLLINEVAWAGTISSPDNEWIELYNPGATAVDLTGWELKSSDLTPDIILSGTIPAGGYFLLERDSNDTISNITADQIYTGALANGGETLTLFSPSNDVIDTANRNGGEWPAGNTTSFSTMERIGTLPDSDSAWFTNDGVIKNGLDYNEEPIFGTPKNGNSPTPTTTATITLTPSNTPTSTPTFTSTPTHTLTPSLTPTPAGLRSVIINEVAWTGTASGLSDDEWIELFNPGNTPIDITGWNIKAADGTPDIVLSGTIPAGGYFLLERGANLSDDTTVSDIPADQIYTGNALSNSGEELTLYDGSNKIIDTANENGGSWPAGSSSTYGTMERISGTADSDSAWATNTGVKKNGKNANGDAILGTPKNSNTPAPTPTPSKTATPVRTSTPSKTATQVSTPTPAPVVIDPRPIINEILPRPGFDWNQDGRVDVFDEFIEIKNLSPIDINLKGWKLDDEENAGSTPFTLPDVALKPGQRIVFYGLQTNLLLSDGGDSVRLINPNGKIYDEYSYSIAKVEDESICRLPDGNVFGAQFEDCTPTPSLGNTREGIVPAMPDSSYKSPVCDLPDTLPADFLFAECGGYGANIWNSFYWDEDGWFDPQIIPENTSKWESFIE